MNEKNNPHEIGSKIQKIDIRVRVNFWRVVYENNWEIFEYQVRDLGLESHLYFTYQLELGHFTSEFDIYNNAKKYFVPDDQKSDVISFLIRNGEK